MRRACRVLASYALAKQVMIEDPSGNPIELFEPIRPEA